MQDGYKRNSSGNFYHGPGFFYHTTAVSRPNPKPAPPRVEKVEFKGDLRFHANKYCPEFKWWKLKDDHTPDYVRQETDNNDPYAELLTPHQAVSRIMHLLENNSGKICDKKAAKIGKAKNYRQFCEGLVSLEVDDFSQQHTKLMVKKLLHVNFTAAKLFFHALKNGKLLTQQILVKYISFIFGGQRHIDDEAFIGEIFKTAKELEYHAYSCYMCAFKNMLKTLPRRKGSLEEKIKIVSHLMNMTALYYNTDSRLYLQMLRECEKYPKNKDKHDLIFEIAKEVYSTAKKQNQLDRNSLQVFMRIAAINQKYREVESAYESFYLIEAPMDASMGNPTYQYFSNAAAKKYTPNFNSLDKLFMRAVNVESQISIKCKQMIGLQYLRCCEKHQKYDKLINAYKKLHELGLLNDKHFSDYISACLKSKSRHLALSLYQFINDFQQIDVREIKTSVINDALDCLIQHKLISDLVKVWEIALKYKSQISFTKEYIRHSINLLENKSEHSALLVTLQEMTKTANIKTLPLVGLTQCETNTQSTEESIQEPEPKQDKPTLKIKFTASKSQKPVSEYDNSRQVQSSEQELDMTDDFHDESMDDEQKDEDSREAEYNFIMDEISSECDDADKDYDGSNYEYSDDSDGDYDDSSANTKKRKNHSSNSSRKKAKTSSNNSGETSTTTTITTTATHPVATPEESEKSPTTDLRRSNKTETISDAQNPQFMKGILPGNSGKSPVVNQEDNFEDIFNDPLFDYNYSSFYPNSWFKQ